MVESRLTLSPQDCQRQTAVPTQDGHDAAPAPQADLQTCNTIPSPVPAAQSPAVWIATLVLLHLSHPLTWNWELPGVWFPHAGVGFVLAAWLGPRVALLVALDGLLVLAQAALLGTPLVWGGGWSGLALGAAAAGLLGLETWAAWWSYFRAGRGLRGLVDPHSATLFLVLVPGGLTFLFAVGHTLLVWPVAEQASFWELVRAFWFSRALGLVSLAAPCLVLVTPLLARRGWIATEPAPPNGGSDALLPLALGGRIEIAGLALATGILGLFLSLVHAQGNLSASPLVMLPLLLIIWASLRQGVRGGMWVTTSMAVPALTILSLTQGTEGLMGLQASLLAQGSTALLVGVSFNWIRASEVRYRHVVEHVPIVLYSARVHTTESTALWREAVEITFASSACRTVLGREPEEILGEYQTWLDCVHPEDHELVQAALIQLWRFQEPVTCEYRIAPASLPRGRGTGDPGSGPESPLPASRWLRDTMVPQFDEAGQLTGWEGVAEDITPQRDLADDLRRTTGMLHTLVNNLPAGVFFVDGTNGQPVLVNTRARQLLGQREELAAGLNRLSEVYHLHRPDGSLYPADELPVCAALERGTTCHCNDIVVHRPDGQQVPLVSWAAPIDLGGLGRHDAAVWILEDLTAVRQAEMALRESEARLRAVIENIAEGVLILDEKSRVLACNPAASALFETPREELQGQRLTDQFENCLRADGTPLPPAEYPVAVCAQTRQPVRDVVVGLVPRGPRPDPVAETANTPVRWLLIGAMPYTPNGSRQPPRVILICTNITAQHEAQVRQRRLEAGLEQTQRLGLVGQISGGLAHDLNNYLTVVLASADLAAQSLPTEHALQTDLRNIQHAGEKASQLARQFTSLSKSGPAVVQLLDLNRLVERTLNLLRSTLGASIDVTLKLCPAAPPVCGNETQLQQVLINLCLNARDAMPAGGRLTVATELLAEPPPESPPGLRSWLRLRVLDTGRGIAEQVGRSVFVTPVSDKEGGAGLGLWMTRRIVQEHGGQVRIHSKPGQGTQVEMVLPAALLPSV